MGDACKAAVTGNQAFIQVQSQNSMPDRFCGQILNAENVKVTPGEIICKWTTSLVCMEIVRFVFVECCFSNHSAISGRRDRHKSSSTGYWWIQPYVYSTPLRSCLIDKT